MCHLRGDSTPVFNGGLKNENLYEEARSYFAGDVKCTEFYENKFTLIVDLRGVDDDMVIGTGRKLTGSILLEIEKTATTKNLYCHVFVVSDATVSITDKRFCGVEY